MVKCYRCHEEIVGKVHYSAIYTGIFVPINYCKYCYQKIQEENKAIAPLIAYLVFTFVILTLFSLLMFL